MSAEIASSSGSTNRSATAIVTYPLTRYFKMTSGNDIYHCYAQPGVLLATNSWMIAKENDNGSGTVSVKFPQNPAGKASNEFEFKISDDETEGNILTKLATYTYGS